MGIIQTWYEWHKLTQPNISHMKLLQAQVNQDMKLLISILKKSHHWDSNSQTSASVNVIQQTFFIFLFFHLCKDNMKIASNILTPPPALASTLGSMPAPKRTAKSTPVPTTTSSSLQPHPTPTATAATTTAAAAASDFRHFLYFVLILGLINTPSSFLSINKWWGCIEILSTITRSKLECLSLSLTFTPVQYRPTNIKIGQ